MKNGVLLLLGWAATLAAQAPTPLSVDGDYIQGACGSIPVRCISIQACFSADFAGEVKLSQNSKFVVSVPSGKLRPSNVTPGGQACEPVMFRLLMDGETPQAGALRLRVKTQRKYIADIILMLRYVSASHLVLLEPNPEG
jgi:hypothetical protein